MIGIFKINSLLVIGALIISPNVLAHKMTQCDTSSCISYFKQYKKAAKRGHPQAVAALGQMYYHAYGTEKNEKLALKYLKKASRYKDGAAQFKAGFIYLTSKEHKDVEAGVKYLEKAAFNDFKGANFVLGMVHLEDDYGRQDIKLADEYFAKSYKDKFEQIPEAVKYIDATMSLDASSFPLLYSQMQNKPLDKGSDGTMSWPVDDIEVITITSVSLETTFDQQLVEFRKPIKSIGTRFLGKNCVERLTCINVEIADGTAFANMFLDGFTGKIVSGG